MAVELKDVKMTRTCKYCGVPVLGYYCLDCYKRFEDSGRDEREEEREEEEREEEEEEDYE
jgi:DNA-directed RNA polymerase subunit RPC12/RpoP